MKLLGRVLLALTLVGVLLSVAPRAEACGPAVESGDYRAYAEQVFVARVLDRKPLEHATAPDGQRVTLFQLTAYVEDTLKGGANPGELVTVYVVSPFAPIADQDTAEVAMTYPVYNLPATPEPMGSYIFFARPFGDGEYVLHENSSAFVEHASNESLDRARSAIAQMPAYYY